MQLVYAVILNEVKDPCILYLPLHLHSPLPVPRRYPERSEGTLYWPLPVSLRVHTMPEYAYVYILADSFKKLYTGITTHLSEVVS
jgi:hypothetical protein